MIDEVDRRCGKGVGMWSGLVPRVDQGETGLRSVRQGNKELVRLMKRKGWAYILHWMEFMQSNRVREEWFREWAAMQGREGCANKGDRERGAAVSGGRGYATDW